MTIKVMQDLSLDKKRVLIRQDLNVPIKEGEITSDARIRASLPTIKTALDGGAAVIIMSHLGRPTEGGSVDDNAEFSLAPVAAHLSTLLDKPVNLVTDYLNKELAIAPGEVCLLENVRFNKGEKKDDDTLAKQYAALCDIYVMDAFGTAHRAQASTHGVAKFAPIACAGPLLSAELNALTKALDNPARPLVAIVGGSKVSTKLTVLDSLSEKVDQLIVGGGIANTFLAATDHEVGDSLYESSLITEAIKIARKTYVPIPIDVVVGDRFHESAEAKIKSVDEVKAGDMIFDIGPQTAAEFCHILQNAGTIIWNGPVGVFEFDQFGNGTKALGEAIASSKAFSIAGGGDTLAAIDKYQLADRISYISTGGGAFLEFVEGKILPAVAILESRS